MLGLQQRFRPDNATNALEHDAYRHAIIAPACTYFITCRRENVDNDFCMRHDTSIIVDVNSARNLSKNAG